MPLLPISLGFFAGDINGTPKSSSDTLGVYLIETAVILQKWRVLTDTYTISINEPDIVQISIDTEDAIGVYMLENGQVTQPIPKNSSDALDVSFTETASFVRVKLASDSLDVSFTELLPQRAIGRSDTLSIGVTGQIQTRSLYINDVFAFGISGASNKVPIGGGTRSLVRDDTFNIALTGTAKVLLRKSLSDTFGLSITNTSNKVTTYPKSAVDTLSFTLIESANAVSVDFSLSWDQDHQPWGGPVAEEVAYRPVFPIGDVFYQVDPNSTKRAGAGFSTVLERIGIVPADPTNIKHLSSVHPLVRAQQGTVFKIYVGMQETTEDPVNWQGPFNYVVGSSYFVDPVLAGRYISLRTETAAQPPWRLMSIDFNLQESGKN